MDDTKTHMQTNLSEKTSGASTGVSGRQPSASPASGSRQLAAGARHAVQPIQGNTVALSTFVASTDHRQPSSVVESFVEEASRPISMASAFSTVPSVIAKQYFSENAKILLSFLLETFDLPEIVAHFPPVPECFRGTGTGMPDVQLQQIKEECLDLMQHEYMVVARLFLAAGLEEKAMLFWDYMLPLDEVKKIEATLAQHNPAEQEHLMLDAFTENFNHYSYALAGLYLLGERMQTISPTQDKETLRLAREMLMYIDAAIKVVQSRHDFFIKQTAALLTRPQKRMRLAYGLRPVRFKVMLERIQSIRTALARYIEDDLLPDYLEKTFHFKEPVPARRKSAPLRKKVPKVKQRQAKPKQPRIPMETVIPAAPPAVETIVKSVMAGQAEAMPEQAEAEPSAETEESAVSPSSLFPTPDTLIPVAEILTQASPVMPVENPRLAGLHPRYRAIYDQVFFSRWSEARDLTLNAVKKLVTHLGGQTKGVGGSRTQIIFNNKSVATIEHRHGKDKAGELYKVSVALLQRGLGIAGFAPRGWVDELSRTRDMLTNFWRYAATREAQG